MRRLIVFGVLACLAVCLPAAAQTVPDRIVDLAWSEGGTALLVSTRNTLYIYERDQWKEAEREIELGTMFASNLDVRGDLVIVGSTSGATIWNFRTDERIVHDETALGLAAFHGDDQIVTTYFNVTVRDFERGEVLQRMGSFFWPASGLAVSPDGAFAAAGNEGEGGYIWNLETGEPASGLLGAADYAFSPDGAELVFVSYNDTVGLWDVAAGELRWSIFPYRGRGAMNVAFHPEGAIIAVVYLDGNLLLYAADNGEPLDIVQAHPAPEGSLLISHGLDFSPDGRLLAVGGSDGIVRLWEIDDRQLTPVPPMLHIIE